MKFLFILFFLFCLSCQTTRYSDPIDLTQDEIARISLVEQSTGMSTAMHSGKIFFCNNNYSDCDIVICKENKLKQTGYECKAHLVKANESNFKSKIYKNDYLEEMFTKKLNLYTKNNEIELIELCNKENVICYLDKKIFPMNKLTTSKSYSKIAYKNSFEFDKNGSHQIEVIFYEVK